MTTAHYTLDTRRGKYGFAMADIDFSAGNRDMSIGLGETVVDSMESMGVTRANVLIEDPYDTDRKGIAIRDIKLDFEAPRLATILAVGEKLTRATYLIHADHIKEAA